MQKLSIKFLMRHVSVLLALLFVLLFLDISAQNERILLLENFTNTGCETCAQQIPELDALIAANSDKVAAIQYHVNWPSDSDPMYLYNPVDNEARTVHYGVTGVPHVVIDGNHFSGTPNQLNQNIINLLLTQESPIEMHLDFEVDEDTNLLSTHVMGISATATSNLSLFVGIIEREAHFDSASGPNGERIFYHVMKSLLPNASGQAIENLAINESFDFSFTCTIDHFFNLNQLEAIAWIQASNGSKAVLQACKARGHQSHDENLNDTPCIYPNPTKGQVYIKSPMLQKVSVFNLNGQRVFESTCHGMMYLNLRDFGTGLFVIKVGSHIQKVNVI